MPGTIIGLWSGRASFGTGLAEHALTRPMMPVTVSQCLSHLHQGPPRLRRNPISLARETDRELARLSAIIKQSQATAVVAAASSLRLDCVVAGQLELCRHPRGVSGEKTQLLLPHAGTLVFCWF